MPSPRPPGRAWLNGPLVWAIDEAHAPMYLFPRDCPRILLWAVEATTPADRRRWLGETSSGIVAYVEDRWNARIARTTLHRYELPAGSFEPLGDAGMHVSRETVTPLAVEALHDLPEELRRAGTEVRSLPALTPLRDVWGTTLHASGVRLRNAHGWLPGTDDQTG